jgi:guanylate kinase
MGAVAAKKKDGSFENRFRKVKDYELNIAVVGASCVGKQTLIRLWLERDKHEAVLPASLSYFTIKM